MITVLAMGQSNAVGRNTGGRQAFSSLLTCWNNENDIDSASVNLGSAFVAADIGQFPFDDGCNNLMIQTCNLLARATGENVRVILVAMGGKPIASWATSSGAAGAMYTRTEAVLAAAGVSSVDLVLWQQGVTDDNAGTTGTYVASWGHLLSNLQSDGYITSTTPIVVGLEAKDYKTVNSILVSISNADSRVGLAKIAGFGTDDGTHFLGEECINIGMEYLRAMNGLGGSAFEDILDPVSDNQGFQALKLSDQDNIASETYTKVTFPLTQWDIGGKYDSALSRYTPGKGLHRISASVQLSGLTSNSVQLLVIYKNGAPWARSQVRPAGTTTSIEVERTDWCNDLDYYEVYVYLTTSSLGAVTALASQSWFEAHQL